MSDLERENTSDVIEPLSEATKNRIMTLCDKAGMPVDWMSTLHMILNSVDNPKMDGLLDEIRDPRVVSLAEQVREDIESMGK